MAKREIKIFHILHQEVFTLVRFLRPHSLSLYMYFIDHQENTITRLHHGYIIKPFFWKYILYWCTIWKHITKSTSSRYTLVNFPLNVMVNERLCMRAYSLLVHLIIYASKKLSLCELHNVQMQKRSRRRGRQNEKVDRDR